MCLDLLRSLALNVNIQSHGWEVGLSVCPDVGMKVNSPHDFRGPERPGCMVPDREGPKLSLVLISIAWLPCLLSPCRLAVSGSCLAQANRREFERLLQPRVMMGVRTLHLSSDPSLGFTG